MKKTFTLFLCLCLALSLALAEDDDLMIEEIVENVDLDAPVYGDVSWNFPLSLEDINPQYVRLANKHYLLDSKYVPDNLVKVPRQPKSGGISWVSWPEGGHRLQEEAAQALCEMNAAMREVDGFRTMYLKSA